MSTLSIARNLSCALALSIASTACDVDVELDDDTTNEELTTRTLDWSFEGLSPLGESHVYEGWIIVDGEPVSTGRFTVDADGEPSLHSFEVAEGDADAATAFVLTIEPAEGDDPAPAATHVLAGDLVDGLAELSVGHMAALGDDFTAATGSFILAAPTTGDITEDDTQGIWFLDPEAGTPSLELPELPEGWAYEGWVVGPDGPISTGRFTDVADLDSDGAGPTAGPDGFPAFPGQDFIDPALDLVGLPVVISVEPQPDDSPAPFALKPLVGEAADGVKVLQSMGNNAMATNPTGLASFE